MILLPQCEPTLHMVAMPPDCNYTGDVFGGRVMAQIDIAGSIPAHTRARGRVVTVAVNSFVFKQPLLMGDVVSFYAERLKIGRTFLTVKVEVYVQRDPVKPICAKVTEAMLTYVAVGEDRRPRIVPPDE